MNSKNFYEGFIYDWWKNLDKLVFFLILSLIFLGIFFSLVSTSLIASSKLGTNNYYFFLRHSTYVILGLSLIIIFSAIREDDVYKIAILLFIIFFVSLLLIPIFGVEVKGSKRWLDFTLMPRFQPVEFLKPFLVVFLSLVIGSRFTSNNYFKFLLSTLIVIPVLFLLPFFQLYSAFGLFDTPLAVGLAHCLFTVPMAVWILEGFMSSIPKELDEMAKIDGHSFGFFFLRIFIPANWGGIGVTIFFCFMFSWVELLIARTLTGVEAKPIVVTMTRTISASGIDWGVLAAAGVVTILPGLVLVWFVRKRLIQGFALGRVK